MLKCSLSTVWLRPYPLLRLQYVAKCTGRFSCPWLIESAVAVGFMSSQRASSGISDQAGSTSETLCGGFADVVRGSSCHSELVYRSAGGHASTTTTGWPSIKGAAAPAGLEAKHAWQTIVPPCHAWTGSCPGSHCGVAAALHWLTTSLRRALCLQQPTASALKLSCQTVSLCKVHVATGVG